MLLLSLRLACWALLALLSTGCAAKQLGQQRPGDEGPAVEVGRFDLVGVASIDEEQLRSVLRTRTSSWLPWSDDRLFDREAFQADLDRIVAFYRDHGYPEARVVSHSVDVEEGKAAITVRITEGEPRRIAEVVLTDFTPLSADARQALRESMPLEIGEPVVYQEVIASGELAARALKDRGYPYAEVRVREEKVDDTSVRVRIQAMPGAAAVFGDIEIVGNATVGDDVIRRELAYRPGEMFRESRLRDSQEQLYALNLFRFATIQVIDAEARPAEVRTRVTVAEGKHSRVEFSAGYGTEEKARGEVSWRNVNFLGGARTLGARTEWSSLTQGAQLDFEQPYLLHRRLKLVTDAHYWRATEPAYRLTAAGGSVGVTGDLARATSWTVRLKGEDQTSRIAPAALADPRLRDDLIALGLDPLSGEQGGLLTSLAFGAERSTTRNPLDPQQGYMLLLHLEQAGSWLSGAFDFVEWQIGGRHYLPLSERLVVASRLRLATIDPSGTSAALPFARRYFLGGSTSLRGWGRYEVSPLSESGLPLGGKSLLESSAEVRARIRGNLGGALFVDAGNVWPTEWDYDLGDLRANAGAGIRYYTPIGPLRIDLAWQLTPIEGLVIEGAPQTRRWRVHFSIGQAF